MNYILTYYQAIKTGKIVVSRWILLLYEKIIHGIETKEYIFDSGRANDAIEWIEAHCFHTEGVKAPGNLILELWQKALLSVMFGILDPKTNQLYFREFVLIVARKNGKSLFAAAISRYVWTRFGGYGARAYCIAPKLDQADIIYSDIWAMTQLDPEWQAKKMKSEQKDENGKRYDVPDMERHRMTDLFLPSTNSTVKKIAFSAKKSDGFNPSIAVCDEIASWEGDKGLKQYEVLKSGMGARPEGFMLSCSTAGYVNDSIYDELIKRSTKVLNGDSKEKRLCPFLYIIDDPSKWNDINELQKSNPNLNVSVSVDYLLDEIAIAETSLSKKAEFLTKYCNIKQNSSLAWLSTQTVEKACGEHIELEQLRNNYAVCGIDLSQTTDLTACVAVVEKDGVLNVVAKFFLPGEKLEEATARDGLPYDVYVQRGILQLSGDNFVDYNDCYEWMTSLVRDYEILPLQTGYDRYSAQYLVKDLEAEGFHMDDVYQGYNLTPVIREFEGLLKDGRINIGDNDLLKIHLLNTALKLDTQSDRCKIIKISATDHIDGCAALLDALTVRQKWYGEIGEQLKNN